MNRPSSIIELELLKLSLTSTLLLDLDAYIVDCIQKSNDRGSTSPKKCVQNTSSAHPIVPSTQLEYYKFLSKVGSTNPKVFNTVLTTYEKLKMPDVINRLRAGILLFYANLLRTVYSPVHATNITTNVNK